MCKYSLSSPHGVHNMLISAKLYQRQFEDLARDAAARYITSFTYHPVDKWHCFRASVKTQAAENDRMPDVEAARQLMAILKDKWPDMEPRIRDGCGAILNKVLYNTHNVRINGNNIAHPDLQ